MPGRTSSGSHRPAARPKLERYRALSDSVIESLQDRRIWVSDRAMARWPEILWACPLLSFRLSRSEEHTSELQSLAYLVCRLLLEKKKNSRALSRFVSTTS